MTKIYSNDLYAIEILKEIQTLSDEATKQIIEFLNQIGTISEAKYAAEILEFFPDKINSEKGAKNLFELLTGWGLDFATVPASEYSLYRESFVGCLYLSELWGFSIPAKMFGNMREWNNDDYNFNCFTTLRERMSSRKSYIRKNTSYLSINEHVIRPNSSDLETIKRLSDRIISEIADHVVYRELLGSEKDLLYSCIFMNIKILHKFIKYPSSLTTAYENYINLNHKDANRIEKKVFHPHLLQFFENISYEEHQRGGEPDFMYDAKIPIEAKYGPLSLNSHIEQITRYTNLFRIIIMPWLIKEPDNQNISIDKCIGMDTFTTTSGEERLLIYLSFYL